MPGTNAPLPARLDLLRSCLRHGARQHNQRTHTGVRTLLHRRLSHECMFGLPLAGARKLHPKTAAAEVAWSLVGTEDVSFMSRHAPIWDKFAVDGRVPGAYGYRWRRAFGRDQLKAAVDTLMRDPSSRQVYVSTWDPSSDGLDPDSRALAPCPVGFTFQVIDGFLSAFVHMRSSDLAVGLPYDVMVYALLLDAVASETGYGRGALTLSLDHAHIYEPQAQALEACRHRAQTSGCVPMPRWTLADVEADPDGYVARVKALGAEARRPCRWRPSARRPETTPAEDKGPHGRRIQHPLGRGRDDRRTRPAHPARDPRRQRKRPPGAARRTAALSDRRHRR